MSTVTIVTLFNKCTTVILLLNLGQKNTNTILLITGLETYYHY